MRGVHKDMLQELELLKARLKRLLYEGACERSRTGALLREYERIIEDRFAKLDSFQTMREEIGKKFRKSVAHAVARPAPKRPSPIPDESGIVSSVVGVAFSSPSGSAKNSRCDGQGKRSISE